MNYRGYHVQLHTVDCDGSVAYLSEKLDYVERIGKKDQLPNPSIMLRQLGKWAQEYFQPRRWKGNDKLITQHSGGHEILVYFGSLLQPQLTIRYDPAT